MLGPQKVGEGVPFPFGFGKLSGHGLRKIKEYSKN
jgi:hypothetical protein